MQFNVHLTDPLDDPKSNQTCFDEPNKSDPITFNDNKYLRIKTDIPVISKEVEHMGPQPPHTVNEYGKERKAYNYISSYLWEIPNHEMWNDLLFVDVTNGRDKVTPGFTYFNVYLMDGKPIPDFIKNFCRKDFALDQRHLFPDTNGVYIPPRNFMPSQIVFTSTGGSDVLMRKPRDVEYLIISYDVLDSPIGKLYASSFWPNGVLSLPDIGKTYSAYFVGNSTIEAIALLDNDKNSKDAKTVYIYMPIDFIKNPSKDPTVDVNSTLQLNTFNFPLLSPWSWWTPECKPAIYLYPKTTGHINVKVKPVGYLTYTNPFYNEKNGWDVLANPNGDLIVNAKKFDYLYYESKIKSSEIEKPAEGFVVEYAKLNELYKDILPKLGLNSKETADFISYWIKVLPKANFYFVGVMEEAAIEKIEPLSVNPKPDSIIRVRLYFKALDSKISAIEPKIITPKRHGFSAVEWGGLVEGDKEFTCSQ